MAEVDRAPGLRGAMLTAALVAFALACLVSPSWVVPARLPEGGEMLRGQLVAGVQLVRAAFAAAGLLAILSAFWWRWDDAGAAPGPARVPTSRGDFLFATLLVASSAALMAPHLAWSFWWDELVTMSGAVRRGPIVILARSSRANNHIINSMAIWVVVKILGESEPVARLPAFALALAVPQAVFWGLRARRGRGAAALAALLVATHCRVLLHGIEARGYAGAILFSYLACLAFSRVLEASSARVITAYVACAVASFGFIPTTIFVPLGHGVAASLLWLRRAVAETADPPATRRALAAVFACVWSGVLCMILFGLPIPQTLDYVRHGSFNDHVPLGYGLLTKVAYYLTSSDTLPLALAVLVLAGVGWYVVRRDRAFLLAFLTPILAWALYLVVPGTRSSSRLYCFLVIPVMMGLAFAAQTLRRRGPLPRVLLAFLAIAWAANLGAMYCRHIVPGLPDLKGLAAELGTSKVLLFSHQATPNRYYFRNADRLEWSPPDPHLFARYDYIVQGVVPGWPNHDLDALGYTCVRCLERGRGPTTIRVYRGRPVTRPRLLEAGPRQ
jgi:hypothetical protein